MSSIMCEIGNNFNKLKDISLIYLIYRVALKNEDFLIFFCFVQFWVSFTFHIECPGFDHTLTAG